MRRTPEVSLMIISWSWFEGFETEQLLRSRHRLITEFERFIHASSSRSGVQDGGRCRAVLAFLGSPEQQPGGQCSVKPNKMKVKSQRRLR